MISEDVAQAAMESRDPRFDGWFYVGVVTTGIYCRPSCPATPKPQNLRLFPSAAAAQVNGFRACRRCRPDAAPGSPAWNTRADLVGRAMRLIADGVVDREGVAGLAARLGYSPRQVHRQLTAEVGAGPHALARAQRVQTARMLLETTDLPIADIAFASGFASIRQFNDTIRQLCGATPTRLRGGRPAGQPGAIVLRLSYRPPLDVAGLLAYLGSRAVPGIEDYDGRTYQRSLSLPHGAGVVALRDGSGHVACQLHLDDLRDLPTAVQRCRRMLDLDADRHAIAEALPSWAATAIPGHPDPHELVVRATLGRRSRHVRTRLAALVRERGKPLTTPIGPITHTFPRVPHWPDGDAGRDEARQWLRAMPGVGPRTADYVLMRAFNDPDIFIRDLAARRALHRTGADPEQWRPWRSYATFGLWALSGDHRPRVPRQNVPPRRL